MTLKGMAWCAKHRHRQLIKRADLVLLSAHYGYVDMKAAFFGEGGDAY